MPKIAISYRRSDSRAIVGRIFDRLGERYGSEQIFLDIDAIPYGRDFREHIDSVLKECEVLIVVVGPGWTGKRADGASRILDQADPVRIEVQTAFTRSMPIIPVLIDDATMPPPGDLPESLQEFSYLNALRIDSGLDFKIHITRLIAALDQIVAGPDSPAKDADATALQLMSGSERSGGKTAITPENWPGVGVLLGYVILPMLVMLLAHYLIVLKLNLHFDFLRLVDILVPAAAGFLLFWNERRSWPWAIVAGAGMALLTVAGMQTVMAVVAGTTLIPSTLIDWQEAFEFLASIQLATIAGNQIARLASSSRLLMARGARQ
jgi:TIR domain